ncbi:MAG: MobC family plasmid mobilization relaxosome protein [Acetobacter sp.]|nr:MobC family plasmid mobilization relaxosome protein [Bacteroides sp.]MCM1341867.1 MobC family plasmid mobilization relaxosome protein [Acetobacter sp.]MCM1433164.1 MobC family plasmid mobilization relaxosome protein [Clostridiales bacterium]
MKRNIIRQFRFNIDENEILKHKAQFCCLTDSALVRMLILGYKPKPKPDKEFYNALRNLSSIGNSINQIAAKANSLGFVDVPRLYKEFESIEKLKDDLYEKYLKPDKE